MTGVAEFTFIRARVDFFSKILGALECHLSFSHFIGCRLRDAVNRRQIRFSAMPRIAGREHQDKRQGIA
jgi:hypothetical protein